MRVAVVEGNDYIEYFDGENWQLGARIVVPEMKGSNEAQRHGSAITYARRFTAQMALQLVCDDDTKIETQAPTNRPKQKFDLKEADARIKNAKTVDEVRKIYVEAPEKLRPYLQKNCEARKKELGQ